MSEAAKKGVEDAGGEAIIFQIPETLTKADLEATSAHPRPDYPISSNDSLTEDDALMFRIPARFGNHPTLFKVFLGLYRCLMGQWFLTR
jgi:NAD(P)H dehydrogenase (quinone)